ncbi:metallopeptidase family protein [Candidatus Kaiserbacteria bacterium]|nr:metallopeptidase family protein [Candidatus Kaiserbacteria bacterium]
MKDAAFERLVQEGFERLPAWVREKIRNVALLVEDEPSTLVRRKERLGPDEMLLGLYQGVPLTERGENYGVGMTLPDTITLYRRPVEEAAHDEGRDVRDVVAETIWHEFAHHFGMDEDAVREREQKRKR